LDALLIPVGSAGDVHPFVGLALALRRRGHAVTIITNPHFEPLVRRAGLDFTPLGVDDPSVLANPDLWHPRRGFDVVMGLISALVRPLYDLLAGRYVRGRTVVVAGSLAFGARIAQDRLGIPTATVHLQPSVFLSAYEPPVLPGLPVKASMPRWWNRLLYWLGNRFIIDPATAPAINAVRQQVGLPPVSGVMKSWWNSPQLVLGLFPDWFGPPQPDWPPQTVLTGFPIYDERGATEAPAGLDAFLDAGEPPVVFTPGSAMQHGHAFFAQSVAACALLGRRGLLLTRYPEQVPRELPDGVRHFDYVPFSQVLPRSAALVHHGGIGTLAQGLAAGVPQLLMPLAHDQFDSAARVTRLGVGRSLRPKAYRAPAVAAVLRELLSSDAVAAACRDAADRIAKAHPLEEACAAIERLAAGPDAGPGTLQTGRTVAGSGFE
jgi:UDP:flavonoid glycosyltransferase YjiC (YdhE family)